MKHGARVALLALVVVVAVVGFILVKPDEGSKKQAKDPAAARTPTTTTPGRPEQPPSPPVANVRVRGGQPVGGVQSLRFSKGETAEFFVTSDVADHVHVHGYDLMKDVAPGGRVKFSFEADIDGQFEIELEDRGVEIATLRVDP